MELHEKLQELRKRKNLTQEELAGALFVSRTAISKWESGRGYPSIDSLKVIASYFCVTIDELLSGRELISIAEKDNQQKIRRMRDTVFSLLDCSLVMLFFIPFFGQKEADAVHMVSLLSYTAGALFIKPAFIAVVLATVIWGIFTLVLQRLDSRLCAGSRNIVSALLSALGVILFIISPQPYAAFYLFVLLIIKGILLLKHL